MSFPISDPSRHLGDRYTLSSKNVVSSAYWKVPDQKTHLTAVACHEFDPLFAVASGSRDSNLFIYEANVPEDDKQYPTDSVYSFPTNYGTPEDDPQTYYEAADDILDMYEKERKMSKHHLRSVSGTSFGSDSMPITRSTQSSPVLTHHQTISLGGIHSLAWVNAKHSLSNYGNVLATGHNNGLVHLVLLPDPYTNSGPAEIISRFDHTSHIKATHKHNHSNSKRIKSMHLTSKNWSCSPASSIVTLYDEHLFLWDPSRSDVPLIVQRAKKARSHHISPLKNGIVSFATDRGVGIMDLRYKNPTMLAPPTDNTGMVSHVKWSSVDENRVASVHDQNLIKIWDIRAGAPLVTLEGHYDKINSIEWSATDPNEFYSASSDGTIRTWDIKKCTDSGQARKRSITRPSLAKSLPDLMLDNTVSTNSNSTNLKRSKTTGSGTPSNRAEEWLQSPSWRLYRQRMSRENDIPSYNYFLDNQNPQSPCTTIFSNQKEFMSLSILKLPLHNNGYNAKSTSELVSIDTQGFFGVHSKVSSPPISSGSHRPSDPMATTFDSELDYKLDRDESLSDIDEVSSVGTSPPNSPEKRYITPRRCVSISTRLKSCHVSPGSTRPLNIGARNEAGTSPYMNRGTRFDATRSFIF